MLKLQHAAVSDINDARDRMASRRGAMANSLWSQRMGLLVARNERFSNVGLLWYSTYIYRIIGYVYMIIIHHYIPRTYITEKTLSPTQVRVPHQAVHSSPFDLWRPKSTLRKLQLGFCSVFRLKYSRAGIEPNFG